MSAERPSDSSPLSSPRLTGARPSAKPAVFCFSILAEPEPNVMPRVLELFAKRNMVPDRWISDVAPGAGRAGGSLGAGELSIDLQVAGLTPELADYIARCLRGLHYVERVLLSEKAAA